MPNAAPENAPEEYERIKAEVPCLAAAQREFAATTDICTTLADICNGDLLAYIEASIEHSRT